MRASAILERMKDPKVPKKYTADEITYYINNRCTNDTLFRLLNPIGQVFSMTNHELLSQLILNNWNYIRTHNPLRQNLKQIADEHNNWKRIVFGPTGKNYKIALISSFFSLLSLWIIRWFVECNSVKGKIGKIFITNSISISSAIAPGFFYAFFTHAPIRDIVISLLSPVLVSIFNLINEILAWLFGLFCNQAVSISLSLIIGMVLLILAISLCYYYIFKLLNHF